MERSVATRWARNCIKCLILSISFVSNDSLAALPILPSQILPSTVQPAQVNKRLSQQPQEVPRPSASMAPKPEKATGLLGPEAEKITFQLNDVILQGNTVYTDETLIALYKEKLHKTISVASLEQIAVDITNFYRNNGFILSRAVLPPQHVANGVVYIRVIEGYVDQVKIAGDPKTMKHILQVYGDNIVASRPLKIDVLERNLRLANEVPGVQVKAVLEPSTTEVGASTLNLVATGKRLSGYASFDNYGTRYEGPNELSLGGETDSIARSGDSLQMSYSTVSQPKQLQYWGFVYSSPFGANGLRFILAENTSATRPGFVLKPLQVNGTSTTAYAQVTYPLARTSTHNATLDAGFYYYDTQVTTLNVFTLYTDHMRPIRFGGVADYTDRLGGTNLVGLHGEKGFNWLGTTHNPHSIQTSRYGGVGAFSKIDFDYSRLQPLFGRYSAFIVAKYQYSFNVLLAGEQFAYGGSQLGRGYDPAEIIGDRGAAGSIEFRADYAPTRLLSACELYAFYDGGLIWNLKNVPGQKTKQSAMSTGAGLRYYFTNVVSGNFMVAQPLTKQVAALELIGNGKKPRYFFSLTASV